MKATINYDGKVYTSFNKINLIQNAYGFDISFLLKTDAGLAIDLTSKNVMIELKDIVGVTKKSISLDVIGDPKNGAVKWEVEETDLDTFSVFDTEITITETGVSEKKVNIGLLTITQEI